MHHCFFLGYQVSWCASRCLRRIVRHKCRQSGHIRNWRNCKYIRNWNLFLSPTKILPGLNSIGKTFLRVVFQKPRPACGIIFEASIYGCLSPIQNAYSCFVVLIGSLTKVHCLFGFYFRHVCSTLYCKEVLCMKLLDHSWIANGSIARLKTKEAAHR